MSNNCIEYEIVSENQWSSKKIGSFKEFMFSQKFCIPTSKHDAKRLIKVKAEVNVESTRIIKTPEGISFEGICLTGKKLVIDGNVTQQIYYMADLKEGQVNYSEFNVPFSIFVIIPKKYVNGINLSPSIFIENISVESLNGGQILSEFTLIATVEF